MQVTLKTVAGRALEIEVSPESTVQEFRAKIAEAHAYEYQGLKLVVNGTVLKDDVLCKDAGMELTKYVVMVAKKKAVQAAQDELKQKEKEREEKAKEKDKVEEPTPREAPAGPMSQAQIQGMLQLQVLMETKVRSMKDFVEILRFHGTVTELREIIQGNQTLLAPILYQINYHAPQLLAAINQYQHEFLQIINEPVLKRPGTEDLDDFEASFQSGQEVVYVTQEEEEAIQRLCALGFAHQVAAEAFIVCNRREDLAANYLFEMLEPVSERREEEDLPAEAPAAVVEQSNERREEEGTPKPQADPAPADDDAMDGEQAFTKLQEALIVQGKVEEALVAVEQNWFDTEDILQSKSLALFPPTGGASSSSSSSSASGFDLAAIRRTAEETKAHIVCYSLLRPCQALYVWVIPPSPEKRIEFRRSVIDIEQLEGGMVTLGWSLARSSGINPKSVWKRILRQFYTILVEPIVDLLPKDQNDLVCFIPGKGTMAGLPFHAVMAPDDSFLIQKHTIVTALSIQMLAVSQRCTDREVGNCSVCVGLEPDIAATKKQLNADHILPHQLTLEALQQAGILHLALQQGPLVELFKGRAQLDAELPIDIVCIGACAEPAGKSNVAEEVWQVAKAAMAAGCSTVVLPLWSVKDSKDHTQVLQFFYEELLKTKNKAQALRQAMIRGSEIPNVGIWSWAGWSIIGHPGMTREPTMAAAKKLQSPQKAPKKKAKRDSRHTEDYRYLKEHRIHVLYEELVREILQNKPADVPQYVLKYIQERQGDLQTMMSKDK